jgi:hypothetical protein
MIWIYILASIGGIIVLWFAYSQITEWLRDREEKRYWAKRRDAFKIVHEQINDCRYWINQTGHAPYCELYEFLMDKFKDGEWIGGSEIREKVTEIIQKHNQ